MKKEVTTEDLLDFMKEHMATKNDLAAVKYEILDIMDRRFEHYDKKMGKRFNAVDARFKAVDSRFDAIDSRFDTMDSRFNAVDSRFDSLENKLDFKFDILTDVLQEKKVISAEEASHLKILKPKILKTEA